MLSKDHNGESKQWHERPAIVKSNLKSILVFVKHPPPPPPGFALGRRGSWAVTEVVRPVTFFSTASNKHFL